MVCCVLFLCCIHVVSCFIMQFIHCVCCFKNMKSHLCNCQAFMVVVDQLWFSIGCLPYLMI